MASRGKTTAITDPAAVAMVRMTSAATTTKESKVAEAGEALMAETKAASATTGRTNLQSCLREARSTYRPTNSY